MAQAPRAVEQHEILQELEVVDGEVHSAETAPTLMDYLPEEEQKTERSGYAYQPEEKGPFGADGWDRTAGGRIDWDPVAATDAEAYEEKMAEFGVDTTIYSPGLAFQLYMIPAAHKRVLYMRAMNEYTNDRFARGDGTHYGKIVIVPDHPEESAEEIRKWGDDDGFVAIFTGSHMEFGFGHERYEPVFEAAEEVGLPIIMHGDSTEQEQFPLGQLKSHTFLEHHTVCHPMAHMRNAVQLIGQEIPERYDVKFGFWEAGQSWCQLVMNRMDREFVERPNDAPGLSKLPSEYFREDFYFSTQPLEEFHDPAHFGQFLETNGLEDQLLLATDWPHMDFDSTVEIAGHEGLTDEQKTKILQDNPKEFFDL